VGTGAVLLGAEEGEQFGVPVCEGGLGAGPFGFGPEFRGVEITGA